MKYDGKSDVHEFLLQFEISVGYNEWDNTKCGIYLATCLVDEACKLMGRLGLTAAKDYCHYTGCTIKPELSS